jgi:acid phosphatase (class A)
MRAFLIFSLTCLLGIGVIANARAQANAAPQVPPNTERPAAPGWLLMNAEEVRAALDPWPVDGTLAARSDLLSVLMIQAHRTDAQVAEAEADAPRGPVEWAVHVLGREFHEAALPLTVAMLRSVHEDVRVLVRQANATHAFRPRPRSIPGIKPSLRSETAPGPIPSSYPSARTLATALWAEMLAQLYPDRAEVLRLAAARSAWLRVIGGAHFPSDVEAGRTLAQAAWLRLQTSAAFQERLKLAKEEVAALHKP